MRTQLRRGVPARQDALNAKLDTLDSKGKDTFDIKEEIAEAMKALAYEKKLLGSKEEKVEAS